MKRLFTIAAVLILEFIPHSFALAQAGTTAQTPVTQQEIDRLKRQLDQDERSSLEAIVDYRTATGDLNNRVDFMRYGGRMSLKAGSSTAFLLTGMVTHYLPISDVFNEHGTNLTVGLQTKLSESTEGHFEV